ncbi:RNA methyltransferase [Thalassomonas sp. M1454]|uniref:RNA methyltransferase n=1 Tax=Thalassomonas sp. M1454 TaxID=2594477 RepID=UPI00117C25D2|nr:RNA methyltransferase [Thalassomonas sp. M1454]TRX56420.1 RNA methyltransferase [Thalassomonas sp. M1454]
MLKKATIGLVNPKSPSNVGSIMRASGCYQVDSVFYSGSRYTHAAKFHTDTKNASATIPLTETQSLLSCVPSGAKIVCVDLVEGAISLPEFKHPSNAYYIFGPEDGTIDQEIIDNADSVVYVPTIGCMNLAATVNVVLYDRLAKNIERLQGDELIKSSRDTNNKVKVNNTY